MYVYLQCFVLMVACRGKGGRHSSGDQSKQSIKNKGSIQEIWLEVGRLQATIMKGKKKKNLKKKQYKRSKQYVVTYS